MACDVNTSRPEVLVLYWLAEHYSIRVGHFLIFIYEGNSNFSVHIYVLASYDKFDPFSASKDIKDHSNQDSVLDEMEDDDSIEMLCSTPTCSTSDAMKSKIFDGCVKQKISCKCHTDIPNPKDCINRIDEASRSGGTVKSESSLQFTQSIGIQFNINELENSRNNVRLQFLDRIQKLEESMNKKQKMIKKPFRI
ncbi:uncharacterized protein LOC125370004 [Ricinus communis]|uniref:Uncharacterized protein n=1 Tax=Ricinus communis TaxID=3988 RepID=B9RZH5_RICCO|nr:uncharacterized protein LOC125370004 [Ricinus communis]EEF43355.1 conserved hypothetical protein [Ricinus communis]